MIDSLKPNSRNEKLWEKHRNITLTQYCQYLETKMQNSAQNGQQNAQQPLFIFTMNIINTVSHFLLGAVAFGAIYFANLIVASGTHKQHIYLCVIGYVILMAQGVLAMNPYNSWSNILSHQDKKICHWVMQVLGSILAIAGSLIQFTDKNIVQHFKTTHGILGLMAMILTIVNLIGGVLNIYSSRLQLNVTLIRVCHSCLGSLVMVMAFLSLCFGFHTTYRYFMGGNNANLMITLTILALIGTLMSAFMRNLGRICRQ